METQNFIVQQESRQDCEIRILKILQLRKQSLVKYSWDEIEFRLDQLNISDKDQVIFKKFFLSCSDDICLLVKTTFISLVIV